MTTLPILIRRNHSREFLPQIEITTDERDVDGRPIWSDVRAPFVFEGWLVKVIPGVPESLKEVTIRQRDGDVVRRGTCGEVVLRSLGGTVQGYLLCGLAGGWDLFQNISNCVVPGERIRIEYDGDKIMNLYFRAPVSL